MITIGECIKRGGPQQFSGAFDLVKKGAPDLKSAIAVQRLAASFIEAMQVSQGRLDPDMEAFGCTRDPGTGGWAYPAADKAKAEAARKRAEEFFSEELPLGDVLVVAVVKDEVLRQIVDSDANMILAGIVQIPALEG